MHTLRLAWRNLFRNHTRTAITGSAIAFSFMLLLATFGMNDDSYLKMMDTVGKALGGGVLVHDEGWWQSRDNRHVIGDPAPILEAAESVPGVESVSQRIIVAGLISSSRGNAGAELRGIDPKTEPDIEKVSRHLTSGTFLEGDERAPLVLGGKTASRLDAELGDRIVLTTTGTDGEMRRALFRVAGILGDGPRSVQEGPVYTTIPAAQRALELGSGVTEVGLVIDAQVETFQVKRGLLAALGERPDLEVLTWQEAMPEMIDLIEADKQQAYVMFFVILLVVGFGIANTILMSVLERVRELGLIAALGLTPGGVIRLVVMETLVLGAVAMLIGLAGGLAVHFALQDGISMAAMTGSEFEIGGVVMEDFKLSSAIVPARWIGGAIAVVAVVVLSSVYPAIRASRLNPVEAMRTYE